jgi:CDGSH-type Zn-finger protein
MTVGFDGTETATRTPYDEAATTIAGPRLVLRDDVELCAEARFCAARGTTWHRVERDDDESAGIVIDEAALCPSGRYTAVDPVTGQALEPDLAPSIAIVEDPSQGISGPLWARGGVPVESSDGTTYEVRNRVTLCRCGASKNKPFCDGTHVEIGFDDAD